MLVRMLACFIFVILCNVIVNAYKPAGISQNQAGSSAKTSSYSQSSSSASNSLNSSNSYSSSAASATSNNWNGDKCGRNSTLKKCPNACPGTCGNPNRVPNCSKMCEAYGCECNPGYVVSKNEKCVKLDDCPDYLRCNDRNATFKDCPDPCPRTCAFPGREVVCSKLCLKNGCECKEGFYLNDENKCVQFQDCPGAKSCSTNETFVFCYAGCPNNNCPVDDNRGIIACSPPYPCGSGCSCKGDYLRSNDDNRCILYSDCDSINCTRPNEVYSARPPPCLFEECTDIGKPNECDRNYPNRPQCICMPGFYRNNDGICVPEKQCPKPTPVCGLNEVPVDCETTCPPQYCWIAYTDYLCMNTTCKPGCDCLPNHLRNDSGVCIPNNQCPPPPLIPNCGENEELSPCKIKCPPQSCASLYTLYLCVENITCEWGCDCRDGYLRDANELCIPSEQCPANPLELCGYNEIFSDCKITCPPQTCDSIFTSYLCSNEPVCESGCDCLDEYLRNESGICVPSEECFPAPECDIPPECRPTCAYPEPSCQIVQPTNELQNQDGCQCQPGYILSFTNGVCIRIEECPDTGCNSDPNAIVTPCPWPCPSTCNSPNAGSYGYTCDKVGCQCKPGFILSDDTEKCILPSDCESGNPCGANKTFSDCAFRCPNQYCPEDDRQVACKPGRPCPSGCVCKPYYLRKSYDDDSCILASDCKNNCDVQEECRPTCAVPNPPNCPFIQPSEANDDSCNCQSGYVLSEIGGRCITIEECPENQTCNGDPNALIKNCPLLCSSTCESPNAMPCKRKCDPIGCECKLGYLKSKTGRCVLPDECEGGNPCGPNGTFSGCRYECPTNYCPTDDSRAVVVCETFPFAPCFSGCQCRINYRRLSREDPKCILSSECSEVNCTRQNEIWNPCPSDCDSEYCEAVDNQPSVCNTLLLNCNPRCVCKKSYYRNDTDICVSSSECRRLNQQNKVPC